WTRLAVGSLGEFRRRGLVARPGRRGVAPAGIMAPSGGGCLPSVVVPAGKGVDETLDETGVRPVEPGDPAPGRQGNPLAKLAVGRQDHVSGMAARDVLQHLDLLDRCAGSVEDQDMAVFQSMDLYLLGNVLPIGTGHHRLVHVRSGGRRYGVVG